MWGEIQLGAQYLLTVFCAIAEEFHLGPNSSANAQNTVKK